MAKRKKWGKMGAPKSAKRKAWMKEIRAVTGDIGRVLGRKVGGKRRKNKKRR